MARSFFRRNGPARPAAPFGRREPFSSFPSAGPVRPGKRLLGLLLLLSLAALPLFGQETKPLITTPPIAEAFPLVQRGGEVHAGCPLTINEFLILSPEEVLHCLYVKVERAPASEEKEEPSENGAPSGRQRGGGMGAMGGGGMRRMDGGMGRPGGGREGSGREEPDRKALWTSVEAFREALAGLEGSDLRLVFSRPSAAVSGDGVPPRTEGRSGRVRDEPFVLPLGLLLGELEGGPTVLAVESGSAGARAGLRSGDRIASLDSHSCEKRLSSFWELYRQAKSAGSTSLSLGVERGGSRLTLVVPLPPRLGGSILDSP